MPVLLAGGCRVNHHLIVSLCGVLLLALSGQGVALGQALRSPSVEQAIARAPDEGGMVAILLYGSDWNSSSVRFQQDVFEKPTVEEKLPKSISLVSVDFPEKPTAADTRRLESVDLIPQIRIRTYPSILVLDGMGRAITVLEPMPSMTSPDKLAALLNSWHQKLEVRDEILRQARQTTGVNQARLLGEALSELGVGLGPYLQDIRKPSLHEALTAMKKADPQDESGWILATEFPFDTICQRSNELLSSSGLVAAEQELDRVLANPNLTAVQRQQIQRQRFLLYKADKQSLPKLLEALRQVASEAPDTIIGRGAIRWAEYLQANPPK